MSFSSRARATSLAFSGPRDPLVVALDYGLHRVHAKAVRIRHVAATSVDMQDGPAGYERALPEGVREEPPDQAIREGPALE